MTGGEHVGRTAKPPFRTTDRFRGTRSRSDQQPHAPSGGCGNTARGSSWSGSTKSGSALHQETEAEGVGPTCCRSTALFPRSEARRGGNEWVSQSSTRRSPAQYKKKKI